MRKRVGSWTTCSFTFPSFRIEMQNFVLECLIPLLMPNFYLEERPGRKLKVCFSSMSYLLGNLNFGLCFGSATKLILNIVLVPDA